QASEPPFLDDRNSVSGFGLKRPSLRRPCEQFLLFSRQVEWHGGYNHWTPLRRLATQGATASVAEWWLHDEGKFMSTRVPRNDCDLGIAEPRGRDRRADRARRRHGADHV